VYEALDAGLVAHVTFIDSGEPFYIRCSSLLACDATLRMPNNQVPMAKPTRAVHQPSADC
jgi:hypothetical protein